MSNLSKTLFILTGMMVAGVVAFAAVSVGQVVRPKEKTYTITESQLQEIVVRRMAQELIEEQRSLDEKILDKESWHNAIFNDVKYVIYTGPGRVVRNTSVISGELP